MKEYKLTIKEEEYPKLIEVLDEKMSAYWITDGEEILSAKSAPQTEEAFQNGYNDNLKGWVALYKDESEYLEYLKWRKAQTEDVEVLAEKILIGMYKHPDFNLTEEYRKYCFRINSTTSRDIPIAAMVEMYKAAKTAAQVPVSQKDVIELIPFGDKPKHPIADDCYVLFDNGDITKFYDDEQPFAIATHLFRPIVKKINTDSLKQAAIEFANFINKQGYSAWKGQWVGLDFPFTTEDAYEYFLSFKNKEQKAPKDVVFNDDIDTIGNCANCGVEFHIHKERPSTKSVPVDDATVRASIQHALHQVELPKEKRDELLLVLNKAVQILLRAHEIYFEDRNTDLHLKIIKLLRSQVPVECYVPVIVERKANQNH
jgi:hypothetical protein